MGRYGVEGPQESSVSIGLGITKQLEQFDGKQKARERLQLDPAICPVGVQNRFGGAVPLAQVAGQCALNCRERLQAILAAFLTNDARALLAVITRVARTFGARRSRAAFNLSDQPQRGAPVRCPEAQMSAASSPTNSTSLACSATAHTTRRSPVTCDSMTSPPATAVADATASMSAVGASRVGASSRHCKR